MAYLNEEIAKNDYTQKIESEFDINDPKRTDIEAAIVYSGLALPDRDMKYNMFDKKGVLLVITYILLEDEYYIVTGEIAK